MSLLSQKTDSVETCPRAARATGFILGLLALLTAVTCAAAQAQNTDKHEASDMCVLGMVVQSYEITKACNLPVDEVQTKRYFELRRALERHISENSEHKDAAKLTKPLEDAVAKMRGNPRLCTETATFSYELFQDVTSEEGQRRIVENLKPRDPFKGTCL